MINSGNYIPSTKIAITIDDYAYGLDAINIGTFNFGGSSISGDSVISYSHSLYDNTPGNYILGCLLQNTSGTEYVYMIQIIFSEDDNGILYIEATGEAEYYTYTSNDSTETLTYAWDNSTDSKIQLATSDDSNSQSGLGVGVKDLTVYLLEEEPEPEPEPIPEKLRMNKKKNIHNQTRE